MAQGSSNPECQHEWVMVTEFHGDINQEANFLECRLCGQEHVGVIDTYVHGGRYRSIGYPELNYERTFSSPVRYTAIEVTP